MGLYPVFQEFGYYEFVGLHQLVKLIKHILPGNHVKQGEDKDPGNKEYDNEREEEFEVELGDSHDLPTKI
jgi:hypothetical protein